MIKNKNNKQDVSIGKLKTEVKNLINRFDRFIDNEFDHLRKRVDWILWYLILGTMVAILLSVLS